jgi:serine/threonine-protein kinase
MATNIPKKLGKYDVLDVLGRGGMGVVYKAIDPGIGRLVAIKMMTAGFANDPDLLKRFYREAQSAGKLQHPNIVTIYDLGDQDGNPYMVMQFLEGESLDSIIVSRRPVSLEQKLDTVIQVCSGLNYAHQHNVIHRDIKPANVMLLKDLTVKIVDFGIARIGNENVTRPGQLMGSVPYMSPEQIKDKAYVDSRTDIFSVGVLLYQLLTNALPFDGKDMGAILLKIIHDPPPPLQTYLPAYPPELDGIIALALAKNPEERYATADLLAFDLMRVQEELKRDMVFKYLKSVDDLVAESRWNQAKEQILQVLRIDRQNSRASDLLRKVEQQIQSQKRSEQALELRVQAEQAIGRDELGDALRYLDNAVELDSGSLVLRQLRDSVAERKARADQLAALLQRAESARDTGELEEAQKAVAEALLLERDNREAQALNVIITREIAEHNKLKQVQGFLEEARKRIATRSFTAALEVLKKAEILAPAAPGIRELASLATSGQEQERRRKQLDGFNAEIEEALSRDNFVLACARADEGLQIFPEDRGLLKLKKLAEKQRQASEKRTYVEGQIAAARQSLDSADPDQSLIPLQEALKRYPQEPALISMLSVVKESLTRQREEQRKADCIQRAKDAIRRKAYTEAIETLEATRKEIPSSDLDDLLQFAQEEAANYATRQKIDAVADQARQFISAEEYQRAIDLLAATSGEVADEELNIILEDARRRLQEFDQRVQEALTTAERLLRHDRYSEAVRFLEAQVELCGKAPQLASLLEQARHNLDRVQSFSITKENAREALSKDDFAGAIAMLQQFREKFGDTQDARILQREIEGRRSRTATAALEKALPDVRMLLMVRSLDSAEGILESLSQWASYADPDLRGQYESLREVAMRAKARRSASELAEKLNQARVSDEPTAATELSQESEAAGVEIRSTDAMSRSQLQVILGEVVQIGDHYQDNEKVRGAIQDFKRRLTLRIGALEDKLPSAGTQIQDPGSISAPQPPNAQASVPTPRIEHEPLTATELASQPQESQETYSVAPPVPANPQSDLTLTQQYADSAPPEAADIPEHFSGVEAAEVLSGSEQETLRQQAAVLNAVQQGQDLLNRGQAILAIQILQQAAAQHPGQSEIDELLTLAEARVREQQIVEIARQADAQADQGQFTQALSTLEEGLKQFPEAELLGKARESVSAAQQRAERLAEARRLQEGGEFQQALELVKTGLQSLPQDRELKALKLQIESDQAKLQRQEAVAKATEEAQQHLRDGQTVWAIEVLQRCATRFPDEESVFKLLRAAERQLRTELELNSIRAQAETLVREGREEDAVSLLEKSLPQYAVFEELLAATRSKLNAKRREELLSRAVQFQRQARYTEAQGLLQQAIRQYGSTPAAADLERTFQDEIEAERRQKSHDAARDKLLTIERQVPTTKPSKLRKLVLQAQQIAAPYAVDNEVAAIALRIRQRIESQLSAVAPPKLIPVRQIVAGAVAILAVVAGIIIVPRLFRVTTVSVEIRTDPPGASVRVGDRSCLTPNCRFDLKPGQYQIEARLDGYKPAEQSLTVDSTKQIAPINLMLQPVPPPPQPPGATSAATGTLVVRTGVPDALVSVDSVPGGRTDGLGVFSVQLEARGHQVRVEKPGFQTPAEQQVDIASAASRRLTFKLDPVRTEVKPEKAGSREAATSIAPPSQEVPKLLQAPSPGTTLDTEAQDWNRASAASDPAQIEEYLKKYPNGSHRAEAESKLQDLAWGQINQNDETALRGYLNSFPKSPHAGEASAQIEANRWKNLDKNDRQAVLDFMTNYPKSPYHGDAQSILYKIASQEAEKTGIQAALDKFNAAFEHQQTRELKDIWPGATSKYLEQLHPPAGYKVIFMLKPRPSAPAIQAGTATIACDLTTETTEPGGQMKTNRKVVNVRLRKTGDRWLIIDPFAQ